MTLIPEKRGFHVIHVHDEGQPCRTRGPRTCRYERTLLSRILRAILGRKDT